MVNLKDKCNRTPLHLSASNGNDIIFWQLLSHGAVLDAKDDQGATALHRAADCGHNEVFNGADRDDLVPQIVAIFLQF